MTKTFCDRCGKEITKKYGWIVHRTIYGTIKLLPCKENAEWSDRADQYICPECEDSFIHWLMNPEKEDGR